jgi:hypothetical protein
MFTKRAFALTFVAVAALVISLVGPAMAVTAAKPTPPPPTPTPGAPTDIQIYGAWHCGNDACLWATVRTVAEFDSMNHWLIDRDDGSGLPSVNLVVLSFVNPLKLLNKTNDSGTVNGVPRGMTPEIVKYFKDEGIRVMLSIGGITFVNDWNTALATNATATQFGLNAAQVANDLGVGIEIDYEENNSPRLTQLQAFIDAYRSVLPYDPTGLNHAARLTIDLGAGNRWLVPLNQKASADWLRPLTPVLDYANAMVAARPDSDPATVTARWNEHITGYLQTVPLAPAKLTGSLWLQHRTTLPECVNFNNSLQKSTGPYVQTVAPAAQSGGTTSGMLGFMFWAAEVEGTRTITTQPPNTCENGMGGAANFYHLPIPMPALRQQ